MTGPWSSPEHERYWDALVELLAVIADSESSHQDVPPHVWCAADMHSCRLKLDLRGQLAVIRGEIDSPTGRHSTFLGERCQYCYGNWLDLDLYAIDRSACPPAWACASDHPDPDQYVHCRLLPGHDGPHEARRYADDETASPPETMTWTGCSPRTAYLDRLQQAWALAQRADTVDDELTSRVTALLAEPGSGEVPEVAFVAASIAQWRSPRPRRRRYWHQVLHRRDGALVPALADGPDVADIVAAVAAHAQQRDGTPGGCLRAAAAQFDLPVVDVEQALRYAVSPACPRPFTLPDPIHRLAAEQEPGTFLALDHHHAE